MEHQVAAHTDLSHREAGHGVVGAQDHGSHYYPGRVYADEKASIEHELMMQEAHPHIDAGHEIVDHHVGYAFGEVTPHDDFGSHLDDHYYQDASVQDHLARAMDFHAAPLQ